MHLIVSTGVFVCMVVVAPLLVAHCSWSSVIVGDNGDQRRCALRPRQRHQFKEAAAAKRHGGVNAREGEARELLRQEPLPNSGKRSPSRSRSPVSGTVRGKRGLGDVDHMNERINSTQHMWLAGRPAAEKRHLPFWFGDQESRSDSLLLARIMRSMFALFFIGLELISSYLNFSMKKLLPWWTWASGECPDVLPWAHATAAVSSVIAERPPEIARAESFIRTWLRLLRMRDGDTIFVYVTWVYRIDAWVWISEGHPKSDN